MIPARLLSAYRALYRRSPVAVSAALLAATVAGIVGFLIAAVEASPLTAPAAVFLAAAVILLWLAPDDEGDGTP